MSAGVPTPIFRALPPAGTPPVDRGGPMPETLPLPPLLRLKQGDSSQPPLRRLNLNESPLPPSPRAIDAMRAACTTVNRYPDPQWRALRAAIGESIGVDPGRLIVGNGSDELIVQAGRLALSPGDRVVAPVPSFPGYTKCAQINGAELVAVPVRQDGANDVDAMLDAIDARTRLVICATPNNPTGAMLEAEALDRLARNVPDSALLLLDEAYHEFAIHAGGPQTLPVMQARRGPWAILRSFSKAFALAGIRTGYCIAGSDEIADAFQKARSVFNVNAVAQAGALAAWQDRAHMRWILNHTKRERERLAAGLTALGCAPLPGVANFVTAETGRPTGDLVAALSERGILIATVAAPGWERWIRITIGSSEDNDALLAALAEILAEG